MVFALLHEHGLDGFYKLQKPGTPARQAGEVLNYAWLDTPETRQRLLDYDDGVTARVSLHLPTLHCAACVWLLERLSLIHNAVVQGRVNFPRRQVSLVFKINDLSFSGLAGLLHQLGYAPDLSMAQDSSRSKNASAPDGRKLAARLGVAGFAFGNLMLLNFPFYLGLEAETGSTLTRWLGGASLALALPVVVYSASDYWKAAWRGLKRGWLVLEVPIVLGIGALLLRSAYEIFTQTGEGYLDSLAGLVFFLLIGRWFQQRTYEALSFERDFTAYFPMNATRISESGESSVPIDELALGERILIRHGEIIPADTVLIKGQGLIDYAFVTGESDPVEKQSGDCLFAGGRQTGGLLEAEIIRPVRRSYLTSLWNDDTFAKAPAQGLARLSDHAARWFTPLVLIAAALAGWWHAAAGTGRAVEAFTAVLIVACPCALALSAPFTLGTAMRILGRFRLYMKDDAAMERLSQINRLVFDKTGTLSHSSPRGATYEGRPLRLEEQQALALVARSSLHPGSRQLADMLPQPHGQATLKEFEEVPGRGIRGMVGTHRILIGSRAWLQSAETAALPSSTEKSDRKSAQTLVAMDGVFVGTYFFPATWRTGLRTMFESLRPRFGLSILSGDGDHQRLELETLAGADIDMTFALSPQAKLDHIRRLQAGGARVAMIGDGLNDAGALKQSEIGISVTESAGAFSPACDAILDGEALPLLPRFLDLARRSRTIILLCMGCSVAYNLLGVSIASTGRLSPVVCAILMPVSSVTVAALAVGLTHLAARRCGLQTAPSFPEAV